MKKVYLTLNAIIEKLMIVIFTILVVDVLWQVFSRYVIGQSSAFTEEMARYALIWLSILGIAYLNGQRSHLSMDFLIRRLSPKRRRRRYMYIEGFIFLFSFFVLVVGGSNLVYITLHLGQTSSVLQVPLGFVYSIVPVSGILILFYSIYHILELRKIQE